MPKKTGSRSDHEQIEQLSWEVDNLHEVTRLQAQSIADLLTVVLLLLGTSTNEKLKDPAIQRTMSAMMEALHQKQDLVEDLESRAQANEKPQP